MSDNHKDIRRWAVVIITPTGERQNVCFGETYATLTEARLARDVLIDDRQIDADCVVVPVAS